MTDERNQSWISHAAEGSEAIIDTSQTCDICGAPGSAFKDYLDRPKALCGTCNSAERQRVLAHLYRSFIKLEYPLEGARILAVAPSHSEMLFLKSLSPASLLKIDLRREAAPDQISDVCNMPEIATGSFDAVVLSGVLAFVHDVSSAIDEIWRVLRNGGVLLHCEVNYGFNARTILNTNAAEIAAWYGKEAYESQRIGLYRQIGDLDFIASLQKSFVVKTMYGRDKINGLRVVWHYCAKHPDLVGYPAEPAKASGGALAKLPSLFICHSALPAGGAHKSLRLELSVPEVPEELKFTYFAEHPGKPEAPSKEVILTGKGVIGYSQDLGANWEIIHPKGLENLELDLCYTTASGMRILQTASWRGQQENRKSAEEWGRVIALDRNWNVLSNTKLGDSGWHGSWSIDEAGGTLMLAEYPANLPMFMPSEREQALAGGEGANFLRESCVWRSRDGGLNWERVFVAGLSKIRHFHTLLADPFQQKTWWLTSGDLPQECCVWMSRDDGDTWKEVSIDDPDVPTGQGHESYRRSSYRTTSMAVREKDLIWVGDDLMAPYWDITPREFAQRRAGAWLYRAPKGDVIRPQAMAFLGKAGRMMTDIGPGYIVSSEAKYNFATSNPQVHYVPKGDLHAAVELTRLPTINAVLTGLSYSRASRAATDGVFFSYRLPTDVVDARPSLLRWKVDLS